MNHKTFLISVFFILLFLNLLYAEEYITKGPAPGEIYFVAPHPNSSNYYLALYHSWDYGAIFTVIDSTSQIGRIAADADSGGIYNYSDSELLYYSSSYGYNWTPRIILNGGGDISSGRIAGEVFDNVIWYSSDYGINWIQHQGNGVTGNIGDYEGSTLGHLAGEVYFLSSKGFLFFSPDTGNNFTLQANLNLFQGDYHYLKRGSLTGELFLFNSTTQELFFSNDSGKTFTFQYQFNYQPGMGYEWYLFITGSQQPGEVIVLCIKFTTNPVLDEFYIYHSTDYGQTWNLTGINKKEFHIVNTHYLFQNYPNPFNGETIIKFYLPTKTKANVTIYNIIGERVSTLLNEKLISGKHKVIWDGTNEQGQTVASGLYLYQLKTDSYSLSKKLLYLR